MELIRAFLLRITAAAIICAILHSLPLSGGTKKLMQILCGLFLLLTLLQSVPGISLAQYDDYFRFSWDDAQSVVQQAQEESLETLREIIISETEAYILDKAKKFGAELTVEVSVDGSDLPVPCGVTIRGSASPYARQQLQRIIADDLGIEVEEQEWIS